MPSQFEAVAGSALGYSDDDTGSVTQATNKGTGVTLNKPSGLITMNDAALGAAAEVSFAVTNSTCTANDSIVVNHVSGGTAGSYLSSSKYNRSGFFCNHSYKRFWRFIK